MLCRTALSIGFAEFGTHSNVVDILTIWSELRCRLSMSQILILIASPTNWLKLYLPRFMELLTGQQIQCDDRYCRFSTSHPSDCVPPNCSKTCWPYRQFPQQYSQSCFGGVENDNLSAEILIDPVIDRLCPDCERAGAGKSR
jgi:hypothetical protein